MPNMRRLRHGIRIACCDDEKGMRRITKLNSNSIECQSFPRDNARQMKMIDNSADRSSIDVWIFECSVNGKSNAMGTFDVNKTDSIRQLKLEFRYQRLSPEEIFSSSFCHQLTYKPYTNQYYLASSQQDRRKARPLYVVLFISIAF